ncbi:MAG: hypothetical protein V1827_01485 [Candidatus Micrarchaeota archaeon]
MVHCLETLKRLNDEAAGRGRGGKTPAVPEQVAFKPAALRAHLNRPWTKRELRGEQDVHETYAKSAAAPFEGKKCQAEGLRA